MSDGIKVPLWINGATLVAVLFGSGIAYHKIDSQQADIEKLEAKLENRNDTALAERIAKCEVKVGTLETEVVKHEAAHGPMWQAIGRKADR